MSSSSRQASNSTTTSASIDEVISHLSTTLFITGAFVVAWSWDLVVYSASHVIVYGEDPLDHQVGFGGTSGGSGHGRHAEHAPKYLWVLLVQYIGVCGAAAWWSNRIRRRQQQEEGNQRGYAQAAIMAIEFFPSPVFAGKLMAYLAQYSTQLTPLQQALLNLAATWLAAFLAQMASSSSNNDETQQAGSNMGLGWRQRTGLIIRDTLGFGLGIAWNSLLANLGPRQSSQMNLLHVLALLCYLLMVLVLALKLAAMVPDQPTTVWERHLSLLAFAMYVVCGFTLVGFLNAILGADYGWFTSLASFGIVLFLAALMSAMVARADLDGMLESANYDYHPNDDVENNNNNMTSSWEYKPSKFGPFGGILNFCIFVPCVWCCCPWVPVLILLAGMTESVNVKEHWFRLIAMVAGLSSSIVGSGMLTSTTVSLANLWGICGTKHCYEPYWFLVLQVGLAVACTLILLPLIAPLAPPPSLPLTPSAPPPPAASIRTSRSSETTTLLATFPTTTTRPLPPPPPARNPNFDPHRM